MTNDRRTPKRHVLIADHVSHHVAYLRRILEEAGYEVSWARSSMEAVELEERLRPDVVLIELELADPKDARSPRAQRRRSTSTGVALCRSLRAKRPRLTLIFTTAQAYTTRRALRQAGADWSFPKPVSPSFLLDELAKRLGAPRPYLSGDRRARSTPEGRVMDALCVELTDLARALGCRPSAVSLEADGETVHRTLAAPSVPANETEESLTVHASEPLPIGGRSWTLVVRAADPPIPSTVAALRAVADTTARSFRRQLERDALAEELGRGAENLAAALRAQRIHDVDGEDPAHGLRLLLAELAPRTSTWRAAFYQPSERLADDGETTLLTPCAWLERRPADLELALSGDHLRSFRAGHCALFDASTAHEQVHTSDGSPSPEPAFGAMALAPFPGREQGGGCLVVWSAAGERITHEDVGRISLFAHLGAGLLQKAAWCEEWTRVERLRREHELGGRIQEALLSGRPSRMQGRHGDERGGIRVASWSKACRDVAGDFHEALWTGAQSFDVVLGDVMGKGLPAAVFASTLKGELLRGLVEGNGATLPAEELVSELNVALTDELSRFGSFATLLYGRFDLSGKRLHLFDCGHGPVLHYRAREQRVDVLTHDPQGPSNLPLGVRADAIYLPAEHAFAPGDAFLFFSDGVTEASSPEALGPDGLPAAFGLERLREAFLSAATAPTEAIPARLRAELVAFLGGTQPADDVTLLVIRPDVGESVAKPSWGDGQRSFAATPGTLASVREFVQERVAEHIGGPLDSMLLGRIGVAVTEAATNIVRHAYGSRPGDSLPTYRVHVESNAADVHVHLHDTGRPFDPDLVPEPPLGTLRSGGYGLYLMRELADEVHFDRKDDENHLTLTFHVPTEAPGNANGSHEATHLTP